MLELKRIIFVLFLVSLSFINLSSRDLDNGIKEEDLLNEVLSSPAYNYETGEVIRQAPKNEFDWSFIRNFIKFLSNPLSIVVVLAALSAVVALIIFIVRLFNRSVEGGRDKKLRTDNNLILRHIDMLNKAKLLLKNGEFSDALSTLITAMWLYLDNKKILKYKQFVTNREYLSHIRTYADYENIRLLVLDAERLIFFKRMDIEQEKFIKVFHEIENLLK